MPREVDRDGGVGLWVMMVDGRGRCSRAGESCRRERDYRGKRVVFGHTSTERLPQEISGYTPGDGKDVFVGECLVGIDTGCGRGGFLSAVELPGLKVYESR